MFYSCHFFGEQNQEKNFYKYYTQSVIVFRDSNPFALTKAHSKPSSTFSTVALGYEYDDVTLNGMTIPELKALLDERKEHGRSFASFYLHGIGGSANIAVDVCVPDDDDKGNDRCAFAGDIFVLGGPLEMPWTFFYNFKFEVTKTVNSLGLNFDDHFYIKTSLSSVNGTALPTNGLRPAFGFHEYPSSHSDRE